MNVRSCPQFPRLALVAWACYAVAILPIISWYYRRITDGSDEPLGVVALVAAMLLLAMRFRSARERKKITLHPARLLTGSVLLLLIHASPLSRFPLLEGLAAVVVLGFAVDLPQGRAGIAALIALSLPLVASLDFYAGYPLRLVATQVAVGLLNLAGLGVTRSGVMILDGGNIVGMDPPCAGVRMLWTACFTAAVLAARQGFAGWRTLMLLGGAVVCVVLGNGLRAALVFFLESGRMQGPHWLHPAAGLAVHGGVLATVFGLVEMMPLKKRNRPRLPGHAASLRGAVLALAIAGLGAFSLIIGQEAAVTHAKRDEAWPSMMDGVALVPVPLSARDERFSQAFPGAIAKFHWGEAEVILRRVPGATRSMHPAGDCLRSAGFAVTSKPMLRDVDGRLWGCAHAENSSGTWRVRERYANASQSRVCLDASAWFWKALLHPEDGPWIATTIIERDRD